MDKKLIEQFKNREIKAKNIFTIKEIDKKTAYEFVRKYHYLGQAKFFSKFAFGLFNDGELVGVSTFANPQGRYTLKGWFGFDNKCQSILELSRLCLHPSLNNTNATSYLLSNSMKMLKVYGIRAVITLADSTLHVGSIYQVCNFKYYGLTAIKKEFVGLDGKINARILQTGTSGVWIPKSRKHRYCYLLDKSLVVNYKEEPYPKKGELLKLDCCGGTHRVFDTRFKKWYSCPRCCGELVEIKDYGE